MTSFYTEFRSSTFSFGPRTAKIDRPRVKKLVKRLNPHGGIHHTRQHGYRASNNQLNHHHGSGNNANAHGVQVFTSSHHSATTAEGHTILPRSDVVTERSTVIWTDGKVGEVMSSTSWLNTRLHLYYEVGVTEMVESTTTSKKKPEGTAANDDESPDKGWTGVRLTEGMEVDVHFTFPEDIVAKLARDPEMHGYVRIRKMCDPRVSKTAKFHTSEQAVVIARRASGSTHLITNSAERTVLHPSFLAVDPIRQAIMDGKEGCEVPQMNELCKPESLCAIGRSLAVRLAPAPSWVPASYPIDCGVYRWAIAAEPYGDEVGGRAVVYECSKHSVRLRPVEGVLARRSATTASVHAPTIQMESGLKEKLVLGSVWHFTACRELPGRSAEWRAFRVEEEGPDDVPISEEMIVHALSGQPLRLIDLDDGQGPGDGALGGISRIMFMDDAVKEKASAEQKSLLHELAGLRFDAMPAVPETIEEEAEEDDQLPSKKSSSVDTATAAIAADHKSKDDEAAATTDQEEAVRVYATIDDALDSDNLFETVFRAPAVLPLEHLILGVPPHEALQRIDKHSNMPLARWPQRQYGVWERGDERPDMRVESAAKKAARLAAEAYCAERAARNGGKKEEEKDDDDDDEANNMDRRGGRVQAREETRRSADDDELSDDERDDDCDTPADDWRRDVRGSASPADTRMDSWNVDASSEFTQTRKEEKRLKKELAAIDIGFGSANDDLFALLHGAPKKPASVAPPVTEEPKPKSVSKPKAIVPEPESLPDRPKNPRVQILPLPAHPRWPGGWWFRPSPLVVVPDAERDSSHCGQDSAHCGPQSSSAPSYSVRTAFQDEMREAAAKAANAKMEKTTEIEKKDDGAATTTKPASPQPSASRVQSGILAELVGLF